MKFFLFTIVSLAVVFTCYGQHTRSLTAKDYVHAESFLRYTTQQFIDSSNISPNWLPGDKFWYRNLTAQGSEFILVDPAKGTRVPSFDQQKLANAYKR